VGDESIWKKEISFRRKAKDGGSEPLPEDDAPRQSMWKKELSFGRKKDGGSKPLPEDDLPKQSFWKKELSFGRKHDDEAEPVAAAEKPALAHVDQAQVEHDLQPAEVEPVAADPVVEPEAVDPAAVEPALVEPVADVVVPEPAADVSSFAAAFDPGAVEEPAATFEHEIPSEFPSAWGETPAFPPEPVVADVPHEPHEPQVSFEPVVAGEPAATPEPAPEPPAEPTVEIPAPPPANIVVHPPVPGAELPPVPAAATAKPAKPVPFWKREISLGRGGKAKPEDTEPKAEKPKRKREKPVRRKREKAPKVKAARGSRGGKKLVGLKVGASQLAAARVSNNGSAELLQVAREPLSPGIVVGGELRDPDALAAALKEFFAKNKLPKRGVRLGIANNRIGVRTFEVSGIDDEKLLDNAIRFRAQEALPIPIDEAVLDYQVLGETTDEEGATVRKILLVVAYREQIDRYVDACKKAGITLLGIDLEAFALLRALQPPVETVEGDASALVGVAIGHERSTFAVSDGRVCEFTRVLDWGGSAINVALARALDAAPSEVEALKRTLSLADEAVLEGLTVEQAAKARDAVRRAVQGFARELVSSLQFYQNQPGSLGIGEIVLTGGTAHLDGLALELQRMIGVQVRIGDPLARIRVSKKVGDPEQVGSLAVAIGLGIED
jgi:type IV pilus assembly protein PilM